MRCSSITEIIWGEVFFFTSVRTNLFIRSLDRPGLKMHVSVSAAGSTCSAEQGQQRQTFHVKYL